MKNYKFQRSVIRYFGTFVLIIAFSSCGKQLNVKPIPSTLVAPGSEIVGGNEGEGSSSVESTSSSSSSAEELTSDYPVASVDRPLEIHACTCSGTSCTMTGSCRSGYSFGMTAIDTGYSTGVGCGSVGLIDFPFTITTNPGTVVLSFYGINSNTAPSYLDGFICSDEPGNSSFTPTCSYEEGVATISGSCEPSSGAVYIYNYQASSFSTIAECVDRSFSVTTPPTTVRGTNDYVVRFANVESIAPRVFLGCN